MWFFIFWCFLNFLCIFEFWSNTRFDQLLNKFKTSALTTCAAQRRQVSVGIWHILMERDENCQSLPLFARSTRMQWAALSAHACNGRLWAKKHTKPHARTVGPCTAVYIECKVRSKPHLSSQSDSRTSAHTDRLPACTASQSDLTALKHGGFRTGFPFRKYFSLGFSVS